jgi:hypothetical protein
MDDRDIDRLLAGSHADDAATAQFAQVLRAVDQAYPHPSTEDCEASHVAAMMETAHILAASGEPATRPVGEAYGPGLRASRLPRVWRTTLTDIWARKGAKVAAIAFAAVLALGGTAYAGALPQMVQGAVATAAGTVGITLPSGSTTATYTVPPGYLAHHSDEVSASFVATIGAGPGNSSHEASHSLVPGNNGLHLGWALGNHFGWYKGLHGRDESGTVDPARFVPNVKGHGPSTTSITPKSKTSHGGPKTGPGVSGTRSSSDPNKGKGMGSGNGHK